MEACTPDMMRHVLMDHAPTLLDFVAPQGKTPPESLMAILNGAHSFSRMLHGSRASSGGGADAFYKAFVPEIGSVRNSRLDTKTSDANLDHYRYYTLARSSS